MEFPTAIHHLLQNTSLVPGRLHTFLFRYFVNSDKAGKKVNLKSISGKKKELTDKLRHKLDVDLKAVGPHLLPGI